MGYTGKIDLLFDLSEGIFPGQHLGCNGLAFVGCQFQIQLDATKPSQRCDVSVDQRYHV